jgi:ABC-2 type transport system ATP-binding protein
MKTSRIILTNVNISYTSEPVVKNLNLEVHAGSFTGLLGPNGAGKSTLLLAMGGQFRPSAGTITYRERDIYESNLWYKQKTGFVHETPFLYPRLTVLEFMRFIAGIKAMDLRDEDRFILPLLSEVRLENQLDKLCSELSFGMRKKLLIATAIMGKPEILLLDEALNGVDFESAYYIKTLLKEFVNDGGTVILSTHVLEVVEKLCNRNLILNNGKLVADLGPEELDELTRKQGSGGLETYLVDILNQNKGHQV